MNRRRRFKLAILSLFLALLIFVSYSLLLDSIDIKIEDLKIDPNRLTGSSGLLESHCQCRQEKIKVLNLSAEIVNVEVSMNNSIVKAYNMDVKSILTCGAFESLRRGRGQKVLSYSVFGNDSFYFRYLELIARTAKRWYPDWIVRVYHDSTSSPITRSRMCEVECLMNEAKSEYLDNVDFCAVNELVHNEIDFGAILPTIWRWLCAGDDLVDVFISRDSDFCVVERDREAVEDWLKANTLFHVMRDHPLHNAFMLAGLWGFRVVNDRNLGKQLFKRIVTPKMKKWYEQNKSKKDADQMFLEEFFRSIIERSHTAHDSFYCTKYKSKPFPKQRPNFYCHVGGYGCCGPEFMNASFPYECPYECRPSMHKEWVFC